jgi:ABC-type multidrug transport system ATPase subunit
VSTFSRGMAQRVALARALAARPELLLLDEPFTALDAAGRGLLSRVLLDERSRGAAVLLSSHDFDALIQICDRIVLLEGGALVRSVEHQGDREGFRRRAAALWHDLPADPGDTMVDGPR